MSGTMPSSLRSSEANPIPRPIASSGCRGRNSRHRRSKRPRGRVGAEHQTRGFGAARAEQSGEADDLARVRRSNDTSRTLGPALRWEASRFVAPMCVLGPPTRSRFLALARRRAAKHGGDELQLVDVRHFAFSDRSPVAHDRDAIAERIQLVEPVTDENHREAVVSSCRTTLKSNSTSRSSSEEVDSSMMTIFASTPPLAPTPPSAG